MIYAVIFVALILALCVARIVYLSNEIRTLEVAASKFQGVVQTWQSTAMTGGVAVTHEMPLEIQEAQTEFEWASNARDSKKESRTIWLGAALVAIIALVTAIVELSQNSY